MNYSESNLTAFKRTLGALKISLGALKKSWRLLNNAFSRCWLLLLNFYPRRRSIVISEDHWSLKNQIPTKEPQTRYFLRQRVTFPQFRLMFFLEMFPYNTKSLENCNKTTRRLKYMCIYFQKNYYLILLLSTMAKLIGDPLQLYNLQWTWVWTHWRYPSHFSCDDKWGCNACCYKLSPVITNTRKISSFHSDILSSMLTEMYQLRHGFHAFAQSTSAFFI